MNQVRITPAHAGKREETDTIPLISKDHPRTCGEKSFFPYFLAIWDGSPPHMRGKVLCSSSEKRSYRITPAHAGKSSNSKGFDLYSRDHPRTCGEKIESKAYERWESGSPPHMRGKVFNFFQIISRYRITPAHAGKRNLFSIA